MPIQHADVVILGSGIAGRTVAETLRSCQPDSTIQMLSREESFLRPLLTKAGFQQIGSQALAMAGEEWNKTWNIRQQSCVITGLLPREHIVQTAQGAVSYNKCIYALGSEAFVPPFPGHSLEGVFSIRTITDMTAIKRRLLQVKRAVVIGGGVIGIEAGEMLSRYGIPVTILESLPYLMPRILDAETAEEYRKQLKNCQVETGITVKQILGDTSVSGVELADGRVFPCELVIVSCGVRPNTAIAAAAGLEVQRGVVVSQRMETSETDIYACGDCAQFQGQCHALWKVAMEQGRVAARNACGQNALYKSIPFPVTFYSPKASLFAMGDLAIQETEHYRIVTTRTEINHPFLVTPRRASAYSRLVYRKDKLVGAALIGDLSAMAHLQQQITSEVE